MKEIEGYKLGRCYIGVGLKIYFCTNWISGSQYDNVTVSSVLRKGDPHYGQRKVEGRDR